MISSIPISYGNGGIDRRGGYTKLVHLVFLSCHLRAMKGEMVTKSTPNTTPEANQPTQKRANELRQLLQNASYAYYSLANPIMEDAVYDRLSIRYIPFSDAGGLIADILHQLGKRDF